MSVSCPGPLGPVCDVANAVASGTVIGAGFSAVLTAVTSWVVSAASWLLSELGTVINASTTPDLGASWYVAHYRTMLALAAVVAVPMLLVAVAQAVIRQDPGVLVRVALVQLPAAALLAGVASSGVQLALSITDWLSSAVASGSGNQLHQALSDMSLALVTGPGSAPGLVVALAAVVVVGGALTIWMELLVRESAVYVATLFLPLALAGLVWPTISHWSRRLVETLAALVLSKFVIVAVLSLAVGALAAAGSGPDTGIGAVLAGAAMLLLAAFTPWTLLRLIPLAEASAAGHLEGAHRRVAAPLTGAARHALAARAGLRRLGDEGLDAGSPFLGTPGAADLAAMTSAGGGAGGGDAGPSGEEEGGWGDFGKEYCIDPATYDPDDPEPQYYWSDGTDGGPRGPRPMPNPRGDQYLAEMLERYANPIGEAKGGLGKGWIRPIWGGEPPTTQVDEDEITLDDGRDLNDPDLPPIWGD